MKLPQFDYAAPTSIAEAVALLAARKQDAMVISGGQSLMPVLAFRMAAPGLLVDLRHVAGLGGIDITPGALHLGARVRWCDIETDTRLKLAHPLLHAMIGQVAHHQIRTRGTVGGSLAHADPAAELPGLAVACDGVVRLQGPDGLREIAAAAFLSGPLSTIRAPDELIIGLRLPAWPPGRRWGFQELARRRGDFAMAGIFAFYDLANGRVADAHIAAIGAAGKACRLADAEAALNGRPITAATIAQAAAAAARSVDPPDDIHASAAYRRALVGTLCERALHQTAEPPQIATPEAA